MTTPSTPRRRLGIHGRTLFAEFSKQCNRCISRDLHSNVSVGTERGLPRRQRVLLQRDRAEDGGDQPDGQGHEAADDPASGARSAFDGGHDQSVEHQPGHSGSQRGG